MKINFLFFLRVNNKKIKKYVTLYHGNGAGHCHGHPGHGDMASYVNHMYRYQTPIARKIHASDGKDKVTTITNTSLMLGDRVFQMNCSSLLLNSKILIPKKKN